jgi:hypothetical protein
MSKMKLEKRWGKKYKYKRNWKEYNLFFLKTGIKKLIK